MKQAATYLLLLSAILLLPAAYTFRAGIAELTPAQSPEDLPYRSLQKTPTVSYHTPPVSSIYGRYHREPGFARLEKKYEGIVRPPVWSLSRHSAGVAVRFQTNSSLVAVRWRLANYRTMGNMNNIGASGVDLYYLQDSTWQFVDAGIPDSASNESVIIRHMDSTDKKFCLYLPLYSAVDSLEIGVEETADITFDEKPGAEKPIIFYGTSITQGASASRPGMAYPTIISRSLGVETINLGFSGNGKFDPEIADLLSQTEARMFVIDCTPNSSPEIIRNQAPDFLKKLHRYQPDVPILLVESILREEAYLSQAPSDQFGGLAYIRAQNRALSEVYSAARGSGIANLYYLEGDHLIGEDHEATVDGTHLTDLGMYRIAQAVSDEINRIQNIK